MLSVCVLVVMNPLVFLLEGIALCMPSQQVKKNSLRHLVGYTNAGCDDLGTGSCCVLLASSMSMGRV